VTRTGRAIIAEQVKLLIREGEGLTVEFKERYTPRIDEDIVAFANAKCGTLILGVRDGGTVGDRTYAVTFATGGPVGGHITVTEAGKTVVDRSLASEVRDVYTGWSSDPRYRDWMTNPALRNFIGAEEQDQYRTLSRGQR
jgi:ATP-dependent DNA helicase RecG